MSTDIEVSAFVAIVRLPHRDQEVVPAISEMFVEPLRVWTGFAGRDQSLPF